MMHFSSRNAWCLSVSSLAELIGIHEQHGALFRSSSKTDLLRWRGWCAFSQEHIQPTGIWTFLEEWKQHNFWFIKLKMMQMIKNLTNMRAWTPRLLSLEDQRSKSLWNLENNQKDRQDVIYSSLDRGSYTFTLHLRVIAGPFRFAFDYCIFVWVHIKLQLF